MQSSSLKTAQPVFGGVPRGFITIVSAFALVVGLAVALALVRSQAVTSSVTDADAGSALIEFRIGEREFSVTQMQDRASKQAFIDHRIGEREFSVTQMQDQASKQALIDHRAGERAFSMPQTQDQASKQALIDHRAGEREALDPGTGRSAIPQ